MNRQELIKAIRLEVTSSFTPEEINEYKTFNDFFDIVDAQNAYEEEWQPDLYKPYYLIVWRELKGLNK